MKFPAGSCVSTPGALAAFSPTFLARCLNRHLNGDWGDVGTEDRASNEAALGNGDRLMSVYFNEVGELLPSDY
jgi:hypothetical protein